MKPYYITFLYFILFFQINKINAQSITITGKVIDDHTEEPLPFSSIYLQGTTNGTTTDMDGKFTITFFEKVDTIVFSAIGYQKLKIAINQQSLQHYNISLERASYALKTITVYIGEDPAIIIFNKIQKNRIHNNKDKLESYQYEVYNKLEVDINKISTKMKDNKLLKPFSFVYNYIDSTSDEKPYLPMYITESLSDFSYLKNPKKTKEVIKASKIAGATNETMSQFLGTMYQDINLYDNRVLLMGVEFISPIASGGLFYYKFRLVDSAFMDGRKCFKLTFEPKRKGENTFVGDLWVNDTTWALKQISMSISKGSNINFINKLSVYQDYVPVSDSIWLCKKDKFIVDFISPNKKSAGLIGRKTTSYKNFIINNTQIDTVFRDKLDLVTLKGAERRNEDYWNTVRHDELSKNEKNIYKLVDTIQSIPAFKRYSQMFSTLATGYYVHGLFEYGPWYNMYATNKIEGQRIGFGMRTSNDLSTKVMISAFVAYGALDNKVKYDLGWHHVLQKWPRVELKARYVNDIVTYNLLDEQIGENNLFASIYRRVPYPPKLSGNEQTKISFLKEWKSGFSNKAILTQTNISPYFDVLGASSIFPLNMVNSELALVTRFAYHEKFIAGEFLRVSIGSDLPIMNLGIRQGLKGVLNSQFEYTKLRFQIDDYFRTGALGTFYYSFTAEKIWNSKPVPLFFLSVLPGNDSYYFDKYAFNNMNRYEFVADQYISARLYQYLGGFPLNYIPLIKKLKWRTFVGGKAVLGNMSKQNKIANGYVDAIAYNSFYTPSKTPYMELSTGIENIFKVLRIDAVWRLNYLNKTLHPYAAPLGLKASIQITF
jgi:hypothetical protein